MLKLQNKKLILSCLHENLQLSDAIQIVKRYELKKEFIVAVFGQKWTKFDDITKTKILEFIVPYVVTKREIFSFIAIELWDPMGILAPVTLKLHLLLQILWETKLSWDNPVTEATALQLFTHLNELEMLHWFCIFC